MILMSLQCEWSLLSYFSFRPLKLELYSFHKELSGLIFHSNLVIYIKVLGFGAFRFHSYYFGVIYTT